MRLSSQAVLLRPEKAWLRRFVQETQKRIAAFEFGSNGRLLPESAGGAPASSLRLVEGRHLLPGTIYEVGQDPSRVRVDRWSGSEIELSSTGDKPDLFQVTTALGGTAGVRTLSAQGRHEGQSSWERIEWSAQADVDEWFREENRNGGKASPVSAELHHKAGRCQLEMRVQQHESGWLVSIDLKLRPRWYWAPAAAPIELLFGGRLRRTIQEQIDGAAKAFNEGVARLQTVEPDDVAQQAITNGLASTLV